MNFSKPCPESLQNRQKLAQKPGLVCFAGQSLSIKLGWCISLGAHRRPISKECSTQQLDVEPVTDSV